MGKLFDCVTDENLSILDSFHSFVFCQSPANGSMHQDGCEHVADLSGFEAGQVLQALLCLPCVVKEALLSLGCGKLQWFHSNFKELVSGHTIVTIVPHLQVTKMM